MNATLRRSLISIGIGSAFPVGFLTAFHTGLVVGMPQWGSYLWPTGIMLMALEGEGTWVDSALIIGVSLLLNAVLWLIVGFFVWWFFDFVGWVRARLPR